MALHYITHKQIKLHCFKERSKAHFAEEKNHIIYIIAVMISTLSGCQT